MKLINQRIAELEKELESCVGVRTAGVITGLINLKIVELYDRIQGGDR